jgi:hypothetical protein
MGEEGVRGEGADQGRKPKVFGGFEPEDFL